MLIGILNRKGGCGKSTTAVHLAWWLIERKKQKVIVVDADGQMSSSQWLDKLGQSSEVISNPDDLYDRFEQLAKQYDTVIVDAPAVLGETAKAVLLGVDLALIPVQPANLDLLATKDIVRLVHQAQKIRQGQPRAAIFLSRAAKGTVLLREAQEALAHTQGVALLKSVIYQRQIIADAPGQSTTVFGLSGEPATQAAKDYEQLFTEIVEYGKAQ